MSNKILHCELGERFVKNLFNEFNLSDKELSHNMSASKIDNVPLTKIEKDTAWNQVQNGEYIGSSNKTSSWNESNIHPVKNNGKIIYYSYEGKNLGGDYKKACRVAAQYKNAMDAIRAKKLYDHQRLLKTKGKRT